jgi:hypothetical protein
MDFPAVLATLNALPDTFKRQGPPYTQLIDSLASSLSLYTLGADATMGQVANFNNAIDGWIDIWGLLFGIPRGQNQSNAAYKIAIQSILSAWVGTVPAIQAWMNLFVPGGTVTENSSGSGYTLQFSGTTTLAQIQAFLTLFNRIRPVGVSFQITQAGLGLYLGTEEFTGDGRVVGNYLTSLSTSVGLLLGPSTPNSVPLLATLIVTDPTISPP